MQRAMARQAEAEREKRAKIIHAQGEFEASQRLADAAATISGQPVALQLRYLQTLTEIGMEKNTTIVFPLPIDFLDYFMNPQGKRNKWKIRHPWKGHTLRSWSSAASLCCAQSSSYSACLSDGHRG